MNIDKKREDVVVFLEEMLNKNLDINLMIDDGYGNDVKLIDNVKISEILYNKGYIILDDNDTGQKYGFDIYQIVYVWEKQKVKRFDELKKGEKFWYKDIECIAADIDGIKGIYLDGKRKGECFGMFPHSKVALIE